jgi:hypothetical protein
MAPRQRSRTSLGYRRNFALRKPADNFGHTPECPLTIAEQSLGCLIRSALHDSYAADQRVLRNRDRDVLRGARRSALLCSLRGRGGIGRNRDALPDRASFATQQPYASVGDGINGVMSRNAQIRMSEQRTGCGGCPGGGARSAPAMPRRRAPATTSNRCVAAGSSSLN